jgi:hypothetical protein
MEDAGGGKCSGRPTSPGTDRDEIDMYSMLPPIYRRGQAAGISSAIHLQEPDLYIMRVVSQAASWSECECVRACARACKPLPAQPRDRIILRAHCVRLEFMLPSLPPASRAAKRNRGRVTILGPSPFRFPTFLRLRFVGNAQLRDSYRSRSSAQLDREYW